MKSYYFVFLCLIFCLLSCTVNPASTPSPVPTTTNSPAPTNAYPPTVIPLPTAAVPVVTESTMPFALDELVTFYRLRIEFTTSSDWTTLELLNPENIMAVRMMNSLWAPAYANAEITSLSLGQPLSAAEASNRIGMTVDYAVALEALDQPLNFLLQKGALNGSTVRIYNMIGETTSLLLQVDHQDVVTGSTNTNPLSFSLDLNRLRDVPPRQAATGDSDIPKMVWAFYYPWYSTGDWESNQLVDIPATRYSSSDPQAMIRQIEQAQVAGIDGFICSWWGPGSETDQNLSMLLDLAAERDFRVTIYFETLDNGVGRNEADIFAWLAHAIRTYGDHPAYMRIDGKPVIVLWASEAVLPEHWVIVSNALYLQGLEAVLIGMGYSATNLELFDGYHDYGVFNYPDLAQTDIQAARLARYYPLLMDDPGPRIFAATVQPGYDDHLLPDRRGGQIQERLDGAFYRSTFEAALASDPDWVFITSWNEWWENTQIEPSMTYGDLYLQITREYVDQWKGE